MHKIHNLPATFPVQELSQFNFGDPDGKDDPILDACTLKIAPIVEFLDTNKSIMVGDRGTGKTAVFRLLSEGRFKFNNPDLKQQIYIPIDEDLSYRTLRDHIKANIKSATKENISSYRIVWELFIFSRCLDKLEGYFPKNSKFKNIQNEFFATIGIKGKEKFGILDILTKTKKTFGVKLEGGHLGYVVPNFYTSLEPSLSGKELHRDESILDLPKFKREINSLLAESNSVVYILIDKLDEFVAGEDYHTQLDTLQALLHCWRESQSYPKLKLKLFLRRDIYERLDFSAIGKDKIDPKKVELKWTDENIRQLLAIRIFYNMSSFMKGKQLKIECDETNLTIDKKSLSQIRSLDADIDSGQFLKAKLARFYIMMCAKLKLRKRDAYDARTTNLNDMAYRAILTIFFPRSVNHVTQSHKIEQIEITQYLATHFQFSNGFTTPRVVLLFMQKCLDIARNYYRNNHERFIQQTDKGEYPVFLRDHLMDAYQDVRKLAMQTIIGLNHEWNRPVLLLMQVVSKSKTPCTVSFNVAKKTIGKLLVNVNSKELEHLFSFYEHAGLFYCTNRTPEYSLRTYKIPLFFQRIDPSIS